MTLYQVCVNFGSTLILLPLGGAAALVYLGCVDHTKHFSQWKFLSDFPHPSLLQIPFFQ